MRTDEAQEIVKRKLCKACWSSLMVMFDRSSVWVECRNDKTHEGFVSKGFVERKKSDDYFDGLEAKINLSKILGIEKTDEEKKEFEEFRKIVEKEYNGTDFSKLKKEK